MDDTTLTDSQKELAWQSAQTLYGGMRITYDARGALAEVERWDEVAGQRRGCEGGILACMVHYLRDIALGEVRGQTTNGHATLGHRRQDNSHPE